MSLVVLAMSGGVDSSVAAKLLLQAGHDVVGIFLRHGASSSGCQSVQKTSADPPFSEARVLPAAGSPRGGRLELPVIREERLGHKKGCCTAQDAEDARRMAGMFEIPFYALDLNEEFGRIMDYFVDEYIRGRTPNPCVMCNHQIKFGHLFDYADSIGADFVATGHYARMEYFTEQEPQLLRGMDQDKDQAYVLFGIRREQLGRVALPVGRFHKSEIRQMAAEWNLRVASKKDSQEICFVDAGRHSEFVAARSNGNRAGEIVNLKGDIVGHHEGIEQFTIGQRKGLGIAFGEPMFVIRIDADSNRVTIGKRGDLLRSTLSACDTNWLWDPPRTPFSCGIQIRYNGKPHAGMVTVTGSKSFRVEFDQPCEAVAPGQAAVCFAGDRLLGGGWIE
jgi:tRNA-uridine 2-sulfurtransferase